MQYTNKSVRVFFAIVITASVIVEGCIIAGGAGWLYLLFALFVRAIISLSALIQGIYKDERTYACSKGHGRTTGIL